MLMIHILVKFLLRQVKAAEVTLPSTMDIFFGDCVCVYQTVACASRLPVNYTMRAMWAAIEHFNSSQPLTFSLLYDVMWSVLLNVVVYVNSQKERPQTRVSIYLCQCLLNRGRILAWISSLVSHAHSVVMIPSLSLLIDFQKWPFYSMQENYGCRQCCHTNFPRNLQITWIVVVYCLGP